ncbi:uncharacterized protein LOC110822297 isoform X2 [Carica papaya]|uniref:uncharacterized protein LOC110822297 isoform X2 n=1 Tax=Carica papaya TaxID=3649 RepID=UPI000B8D12B9|nr:uncharacterized protein LOC110822297 isoform X2 [Carica papaya]
MARQGHSVVTKPSRSDEVLDADEQIKIANEVRAHFDSLAPKRHTKPNRSEQDMADSAMPLLRHDMPEHDRLLSLQSQSYDEYVETQYYKELASVDKQHHTTGSGFIRMVRGGGEEEEGYGGVIRLGSGHVGEGLVEKRTFRSNPATNDWISTVEDDDRVFISSKPNRSESS